MNTPGTASNGVKVTVLRLGPNGQNAIVSNGRICFQEVLQEWQTAVHICVCMDATLVTKQDKVEAKMLKNV